MKRSVFILISLIYSIGGNSQDTVKMMQYNLLNYGVNTSYCTTSNNNVDYKNHCLSTIIKYAKPDIITVNEISSDPYYHQYLLDSALNVDGVNYYGKSGFTNYAGSDIINMLYFNTVKFTLKSQTYITTNIRDINIYKLYYNSSDLATTHDTAYITCISAHLKAGNTAGDQSDRADMAYRIMYYLNNINADNNYTLSGDFNLYTGDELAFQTFINFSNPLVRFNDPINQIGNWNNNAAFAPYHTQSTHITSNCAAGGGMDDRFDFILISNNLKNGIHHYLSLPNTYWAIGQDGNRFNQTINVPENFSVPSDVADALYGMSDHLPVVLKFKVDQHLGLPYENKSSISDVVYNNPVSDILDLTIVLREKSNISIEIISVYGQLMYQSQYKYNNPSFHCKLPLKNLQKGIYLLKITDENNHHITKKIIKM